MARRAFDEGRENHFSCHFFVTASCTSGKRSCAGTGRLGAGNMDATSRAAWSMGYSKDCERAR